MLPSRTETNKPDFADLAVDDLYAEAKITAAEELLGVREEVKPLVFDAFEHGSLAMQESLEELIVARGMTDLLDVIRQQRAERWGKMTGFFAAYDPDAVERLLEALSEVPAAELTPGEAMRLDRLAELCETLNLNDVGAWPKADGDSWHEFMATVELVLVLGGFDAAEISAEAQVALDRLRLSDDRLAFFALLDGASGRSLDNWADVEDPDTAARLLVRRLWQGVGAARVGAAALWDAPVPDVAAPLIRDALPRFVGHSRNQTVAAHRFCR